jgi:hypothetical protein
LEAEVDRLKKDRLRACAVKYPVEAETCFHHTVDVARRQQAKSVLEELR